MLCFMAFGLPFFAPVIFVWLPFSLPFASCLPLLGALLWAKFASECHSVSDLPFGWLLATFFTVFSVPVRYSRTHFVLEIEIGMRVVMFLPCGSSYPFSLPFCLRFGRLLAAVSIHLACLLELDPAFSPHEMHVKTKIKFGFDFASLLDAFWRPLPSLWPPKVVQMTPKLLPKCDPKAT